MAVLSVITVTHRRLELLRRKADTLASQTLRPQLFEWCVASNGDAAAASLLRGLRTPFALRLLSLDENQPVAAARNAAARLANGELLLLSDDDVLLPPGCLAAHLAAHGYDPATGTRAAHASRRSVVVGDLRLPPEGAAAGEGPTAAKRTSAGAGDAEREPFERVAALGGRALWINATGANTSLARADFEAVGGYDPAFAAYGGEDSDLALRLERGGARFQRSAAAWAEHVGRVSEDLGKAEAAGRAGVRVWRKHGGLGPALLLGVHPVLLSLKRIALATPLRALWGRRTAAYEAAYLRGAAAELARGPAAGAAERARGPEEAPTELARGPLTGPVAAPSATDKERR